MTKQREDRQQECRSSEECSRYHGQKSNEGILKTTNSKRKTMCRIMERQTEFLGHMMRRRKLEHLITRGKDAEVDKEVQLLMVQQPGQERA